MLLAFRSLVLIGLLLLPFPALAQWEGRAELDDWIVNWVRVHYPTALDDVERVLADPGHTAAEVTRGSATIVRVGAPVVLTEVANRVPHPAARIISYVGLVAGEFREYNSTAYLIDRMADAYDQLPSRYRPTPIIKKPGKETANRGPFLEFEVIPPARVPQNVTPAARGTQEAINLPQVDIQGKLYPKEYREGWSNWEKPEVERVPEVSDGGVNPDNPLIQDDTPEPSQAAVSKQPLTRSDCQNAHGRSTPAFWRCMGNERMARAEEERLRRR